MRVPVSFLLLTACLMLFAAEPVNGQSMIDLTKEEVRVNVKNMHREFRRDNSVVNQRYNYLKYVNGLKTRTWILYFTDEDICRSTKMVCDYGEFDEVLEELNKKYEMVEESVWAYELNGDTIQVTLTRQEWYFTVREERLE